MGLVAMERWRFLIRVEGRWDVGSQQGSVSIRMLDQRLVGTVSKISNAPCVFFQNDLPAPQQWTMDGQDNCPHKLTSTSFMTMTHRGAHARE